MPPATPILYIIAGCNGAGKTSFAKIFLPREIKCLRFLNVDEIARGLSPLNPTQSAIKAGRILVAEIAACLKQKETFALGTTLSGKTHVNLLRRARALGYEIELHYLWLSSPRQAISRVRQRVRTGGHNVPPTDIRRRFFRGLSHLFDDYLPLATRWVIWDNRKLRPQKIALSASTDIETARTMIET
jgi:predicted ABC-type ATPase